MERLKISASQVSKFRRCRRAYASEYVEHFWPPASPKQKFGTEVHAHLEKWISRGTLPPQTASGELAKAAIASDALPVPSTRLLVENKFVFPWNEQVDVGGFIDLCIPPHIAEDGVPLVIDYKTTSDLRWAKTEPQLATDEQAILYSIQAMLEYRVPRIRARWIYLAATAPKSGLRKPRGVKSCEVTFDCREPTFLGLVQELDKDIQEISRIRRLQIKARGLQPSPEACEMFGGCFHKGRCQLGSEDVLGAFMEKEIVKHNKT